MTPFASCFAKTDIGDALLFLHQFANFTDAFQQVEAGFFLQPFFQEGRYIGVGPMPYKQGIVFFGDAGAAYFH